MFLIVGLGNPGKKFERTRHNVGWTVLDEVARRAGLEVGRKQHQALTGVGLIQDQNVMLAKPQTFMNLSGTAVSALSRYNRIEAGQILVVCDDLNLPTGKLRLRAGGSDGGQNGLKNITQMLGHQNYARLRFGIGAPSDEERVQRGTADYVLSPFAPADAAVVAEAIARAADCIETFVTRGIEAAMNDYNRG